MNEPTTNEPTMNGLGATLRQSVDTPVALPSSIDTLEQRARRHVRRRRATRTTLAAFGIAAAAGLLLPDQGTDDPTLRVVGSEARTGSYRATVAGGHRAEGDWRIVIVRGTEQIELDDRSAPACADATVLPGDEVHAEIGDAGSSIQIGEGFGCTDP